jgi:hypothetical protein
VLTPTGNLWIATSPHWSLEKSVNPEEPSTWSRIHGGVSYLDTKGTAARTDDIWTGTSCENLQGTLTCQVQALAIDGEGWIWAAIQGRGVMYFRSDEATLVDDRAGASTSRPPGGDSVEAD